jgi:hypothetical protein
VSIIFWISIIELDMSKSRDVLIVHHDWRANFKSTKEDAVNTPDIPRSSYHALDYVPSGNSTQLLKINMSNR